jgi:hypothetical protein
MRMAVEWFYGRGSDITGPVTGEQLTELAAGGQVVPTDTVWKDQGEEGFPAGEVPDLFPATAAAAVEPAAPAAYQPPVSKARAVAGKGVVLMGQDGKNVKFRGKCSVCGREEASWKSIPIPRGVTRTGFFCAKCRKRRDGEVYGYH